MTTNAAKFVVAPGAPAAPVARARELSAPLLPDIYGASSQKTPVVAVPLNAAAAPVESQSLTDEHSSALEKLAKESTKPGNVVTLLYFALWYAFNVGYNVYNKRLLNVLPLPWSMAVVQQFAGIPYLALIWGTGLRKGPSKFWDNIKFIYLMALCHLGVHLGLILSLGAGAVSFTHIVKASEPVVTAALAAVLLKQIYAPSKYLALLPIIGGVCAASLGELSFTWYAFTTAMVSNFFSSLRGTLGKMGMDGKSMGNEMHASNLFGLLTILAFFTCIPISFAMEGSKIIPAWNAAIASGVTASDLITKMCFSGLFYYFYNEVAFIALDSVSAVTHAVGNTMKRVVIILASVTVLQTPLTPLGWAGSAIAVLGTMVYSLVGKKATVDKAAEAAKTIDVVNALGGVDTVLAQMEQRGLSHDATKLRKKVDAAMAMANAKGVGV